MTDIVKAINLINPNASYVMDGDNYEGITWLDGTTPISKSDIETKQTELQTAYDNLEYQRKRKSEYPSIEECVHAILDDDLVALQEKRNAIKLKYPKE